MRTGAISAPIVGLLFWSLLGCSGVDATAPYVPRVASISLVPGEVVIAPGTSYRLMVQVRDASGNPLSPSLLHWASTAPGVATVDDDGRVTGHAVGVATLRAFADGVSDSTRATVRDERVASVEVQPGAVSLRVGEARRLTAIAKNAAGDPLPGRVASWSSDAPGVASVASDGTVLAHTAGRAQIGAAVEGKSGQSLVTVADTESSSTTWPHEPAGFTPVSDQPWGLLTALGWVLQFGTALIGADLGAPLSPPTVLTIMYPIGFAGGSAPGTLTRTMTPSRQIFTGLWWKVSDPWQGHESNVNKLQFLFPTSGGDMTMVMYGPPSGPYQLRVIPQFPGMPSEWLLPNVANVPVTLGEWHRVEWLVEYADQVGSGRVRWWLDGELLGDHIGVPFPDAGMLDYKISPTWGGVGDVKHQIDYYWIDHTYLSQR